MREENDFVLALSVRAACRFSQRECLQHKLKESAFSTSSKRVLGHKSVMRACGLQTCSHKVRTACAGQDAPKKWGLQP